MAPGVDFGQAGGEVQLRELGGEHPGAARRLGEYLGEEVSGYSGVLSMAGEIGQKN